MRQIKPSTSTQFPVGSKVRVLGSGHCYSGYRDMARYMGVDIRIPSNPFLNGEIGVVVAKALHEDGEREVLAVRVGRGIGLIDTKGVVEHEELKPIKWCDMVVGQTVRFTDLGQWHDHWMYKLNKDYIVEVDEYGQVGPKNPNGYVPSRNWADWQLVLVSGVVTEPEPTVEQLKAELATVKAKLWEAEQKLNKITSLIAG